MALSLIQNYTAIVPGNFAQFSGTGGSPPYVYSVLAGGAGGSINSSTGAYSAPAAQNDTSPSTLYDTIQVVDSLAATATSTILVANPLFLLLDILQTRLGLDNQHIYLFDQKIFQPTDSGLYLIVSVVRCKPFGNDLQFDSSGNSIQTVNMAAEVDINIISRSTQALVRKEEVILALNSVYSQQQQEANGFYVGKLPVGGQFLNLSEIDGAAIPYRYKISIILQYFVKKTVAAAYYNQFQTPTLATNP